MFNMTTCVVLLVEGQTMREPKGSLTAAQYEIMSVVWEVGDAGVTIADIWQKIAAARDIGRTTVLNQVDAWRSATGCAACRGTARPDLLPRYPTRTPRGNWWPALCRIIFRAQRWI